VKQYQCQTTRITTKAIDRPSISTSSQQQGFNPLNNQSLDQEDSHEKKMLKSSAKATVIMVSDRNRKNNSQGVWEAIGGGGVSITSSGRRSVSVNSRLRPQTRLVERPTPNISHPVISRLKENNTTQNIKNTQQNKAKIEETSVQRSRRGSPQTSTVQEGKQVKRSHSVSLVPVVTRNQNSIPNKPIHVNGLSKTKTSTNNDLSFESTITVKSSIVGPNNVLKTRNQQNKKVVKKEIKLESSLEMKKIPQEKKGVLSDKNALKSKAKIDDKTRCLENGKKASNQMSSSLTIPCIKENNNKNNLMSQSITYSERLSLSYVPSVRKRSPVTVPSSLLPPQEDPAGWRYFRSKLSSCPKCKRCFYPYRIETHVKLCNELRDKQNEIMSKSTSCIPSNTGITRPGMTKSMTTNVMQSLSPSLCCLSDADMTDEEKKEYEEHIKKLKACKKCKRTFFPSRLRVHEKSCLGIPVKPLVV